VGQLRWQRGMALVVSLILLITVTLVGLAGMRGTILQERMAGGAYDRETGFQAAEAALILGATALSGSARIEGSVISRAYTVLDGPRPVVPTRTVFHSPSR